jgi:hypothetical protein
MLCDDDDLCLIEDSLFPHQQESYKSQTSH